MYTLKLLKSKYAEITIQGQPGIIVGSIYKHSSMSISDFNIHQLGSVLDKSVKKENLLFCLKILTLILFLLIKTQQWLVFPILSYPMLSTRVSTTSKTFNRYIFVFPNQLWMYLKQFFNWDLTIFLKF